MSLTFSYNSPNQGEATVTGHTDKNNVAIINIPTTLLATYNVTSIGDNALYNCRSLKSVTIPDSVTSIGTGAFDTCSALQNVTIGDNVTSIGNYAFYFCIALQSVTIPDSVTTIGDFTFKDSGLETVYLTSNNSLGYTETTNNVSFYGATVTVEVVSSNNPPQFDSDAPTTATEDVLYTYTPQVSDPDGDSLTITAPTLPGWLTFDGTTLSGIPRQSNPGANTVKLVVSDGTDTAEQDITIVVTLVNDAPVFTTAPVTSATAELPYSYQPQVSDEENNTLTEITVGTLPEWLTFESGVLSGTPPLNADKLTDIELTVSETDTAEKLSTKQSFTITLNYDVKTITGGEYHKLPVSGLGNSGEGFDFSVKQLIITNSISTYNPTWYGAKTIIETDKVVPYEDGKVLVRDSRLDNATESERKQIAAEWAIQNNHYNFYYDVEYARIFINESIAGNYILKDNSRYNTVFINQKREQVFGGRVILKERYSADFVIDEESTHQIDVSKILYQPSPLQLIPFEFPTWLTYDLVNGVYTLTGKPTDAKTQLAKINVKDADGNTYVLTVHVKVDLYNESKLVGKQLGDLTRDFETELL